MSGREGDVNMSGREGDGYMSGREADVHLSHSEGLTGDPQHELTLTWIFINWSFG